MEIQKGDTVVFNDHYFNTTMRSRSPLQTRPMLVQRERMHIVC